MFNPISTMGNNTLFCHEDPYVCAKLISALMKTDVLGGGVDRLTSYLTTYTSRRVNYSTQQTSCFWQKISGSECLLLDLH